MFVTMTMNSCSADYVTFTSETASTCQQLRITPATCHNLENPAQGAIYCESTSRSLETRYDRSTASTLFCWDPDFAIKIREANRKIQENPGFLVPLLEKLLVFLRVGKQDPNSLSAVQLHRSRAIPLNQALDAQLTVKDLFLLAAALRDIDILHINLNESGGTQTLFSLAIKENPHTTSEDILHALHWMIAQLPWVQETRSEYINYISYNPSAHIRAVAARLMT